MTHKTECSSLNLRGIDPVVLSSCCFWSSRWTLPFSSTKIKTNLQTTPLSRIRGEGLCLTTSTSKMKTFLCSEYNIMVISILDHLKTEVHIVTSQFFYRLAEKKLPISENWHCPRWYSWYHQQKTGWKFMLVLNQGEAVDGRSVQCWVRHAFWVDYWEYMCNMGKIFFYLGPDPTEGPLLP